MADMFIIGTGPSELHAHMDLYRRCQHFQAHVETTVMATSHHGGQWSVLATVRDRPAEQAQ